MQISLLIVLAIPLFLAPWGTHSIYQLAFDRQVAQIRADNAGITLGQLDRFLFNAIRAANRIHRAWDLVHDGFHLCALVPATAAYCRPIDVGMERAIAQSLRLEQLAFESAWLTNPHRALPTGDWRRRLTLPVRLARCRICRGNQGFELSAEPPFRTELQVRDPTEANVAITLRGKSFDEKWNYRMEARTEHGTRQSPW